jgi:hypothetical protein
MKHFFILTVFISIFAACKKDTINNSISTQVASNGVVYKLTDYSIEKLEYDMYVPCTNESVHVTGEVVTRVIAINVAGNAKGYHLKMDVQYRNMKGTGASSGKSYKANYQYHFHENFSWEETHAGVWKINSRLTWITPGNGNNFTVIYTLVSVQNANGAWTTRKESESVYCQ